MKNLKKVLALVLAFACAFTMFAGAAFTDQADIETSEAVDTLVALGVLNGYNDGSFRPDAIVTRAEMAKMIYIIRTNRSDASAYNDDATTFTDIGTHWARGYIKYCQSLGIIAGKSATRFDPDAPVTTQEAAKMLLVTLGYDAKKAGLVGTGWGQKTIALADENGLLLDVTCGTTSGMPRQYAAQLIYNAVQAETVQWRDDAYYNTNIIGRPNETIGAKYMDLTIYEGVLTSSGKTAYIGSVAGTDKLVAMVDKKDGQTQAAAAKTFTYDDVDLTGMLGEYVKVLAGKNDEVYGVTAPSDKNTVIDTTTDTVKDQSTDSIKVNGTKYDLDSNFRVYDVVADTTYTTIATTAANSIKFVDNDDDNDFDLAIVVPVGVAKVTFVGTDNITLDKKMGNANLKSVSQKTADMIVYDGVAKDDYVVFQKDLYTQKDMIAKADMLEGTISGVKGSEWQINGTWYKLFGDAASYNSYTPVSGDTVKAVAIGSKLYYIEKVSGANSAKDVVMLISTSNPDGISAGKASLLKSDGTKVTAEYKLMQYDSDGNGTLDTTSTLTYGGLYTYSIDNDGKYELTAAAANIITDYTYHAAGSVDLTTDDEIDASFSIDDDAVVYLFGQADTGAAAANANNVAKIITGKELKSMTEAAYADSTAANESKIANVALGYYTSKVNGIQKATIVAVKVATNVTTLDKVTGQSSANYGYLVDDAYGSTENGKDYVNFKLWNGTATVDVKWETNTSANSFKKHDVIGYDDMGDGMIKNVQEITLYKDALTGGAGTKNVQFGAAGKIYEITGDTVVLYVNGSADDAANIGVAGGAMSNALNPATGVYVQNAKYDYKNGNELTVLVVDVNNRLADRDMGMLTITDPSAVEVSVNGTSEANGTNVIGAGDVVTVKNVSGVTKTVSFNNVIGTNSFTVAAGASVTVTVNNNTTLTVTVA